MSRPTPWIAVGGLAAALMACPARTPPPLATTPTPPAFQVPPGCEKPQTGDYHHADNPAFRYRGEDDGRTLTLSVTRGGPRAEAGADAGTGVSIVLQRTPGGFVGETRATAFTPAGTPCPVRFETQATACDEQGLTLRSVMAKALDESCLPATSGPTPDWKGQRLLRGTPDAGLRDAGTPDAGLRDAGTPDAGVSDAGTPDAGVPRPR